MQDYGNPEWFFKTYISGWSCCWKNKLFKKETITKFGAALAAVLPSEAQH